MEGWMEGWMDGLIYRKYGLWKSEDNKVKDVIQCAQSLRSIDRQIDGLWKSGYWKEKDIIQCTVPRLGAQGRLEM